jgi:16S rRNA (guanine527-N7)-methyltransferase
MNVRAILKQAATDNSLTLAPVQIEQCAAFLTLIQRWNRVFNLTTILAPRDMVYLHIIDSLLVQPFLSGDDILDVGSGAGIPGIPLAILNPEKRFTLLDKNNKKTRFMTQAVAELGLKNVTVVHTRTEDFHPERAFDNILSRAFGSLLLFTDITRHLLKKEGTWIAMKGKYPQDELDELPNNVSVSSVERITVKGMDIERHIICLRQKM